MRKLKFPVELQKFQCGFLSVPVMDRPESPSLLQILLFLRALLPVLLVQLMLPVLLVPLKLLVLPMFQLHPFLLLERIASTLLAALLPETLPALPVLLHPDWKMALP